MLGPAEGLCPPEAHRPNFLWPVEVLVHDPE